MKNIFNENCKLQKFLGCNKYDSNPPLYCRIFKKLRIYSAINRYFKKSNKKIHPFVVNKYRLRVNEIQYE